MNRTLSFAAITCLAMPALASAAITDMTDATGRPLLDRLFAGTAINPATISGNDLEYVGQVSGGAQAGLFDSLTIRGDANTTLTLGQGIVLTSGLVTNLPNQNTQGSYSNITDTGGNNYFADFPAQTGTSRHGGRLDEKDENSLTFDVDIPSNVVGIRAHFAYASEEFPEWSGTQFADGFAFFVNNTNYAVLPDGRPVSLLRQEDNIHFMTNGDEFDPSVPSVVDLEYDGITRILDLTAAVRPGQRETITIVVADTGDEIYDSAVFLSSFELITGTAPLLPTETKVRSRSSVEDDAFIEFSTVPEPGAGTAVLVGAAAGLIRRRRR